MDHDGPVVIRPSLSRSGSTKLKKHASKSRLSFGPGEELADDAGGSEVFTPKKSSLGQRVLENSALRSSVSQRLPARSPGEDEDRPRYSKEYLQELQSSTPNTPQNLSSLRINDDEMDLDPSELEGAMVVEASELATLGGGATASVPHVLTEAEIQERKDRRARLALEQEVISFDDGEDDANGNYISLLSRKKEPETRLVREDEDLGEGYDEFVEDGRLSLGKKAEREARKRRKQEMAELINTAEADEDEASDDSEAERRAAYEAAQTRAGMDGLHRADAGYDEAAGDGPVMIPKMKPLPDLADCLARMQNLVQGLQDEVTKKQQKIAAIEKEKEEIVCREKEVQDILDKTGQKYQSVMPGADAAKLATQSPLRPVPPGLASDFPAERGLESLGTTPTRRPDVENVF